MNFKEFTKGSTTTGASFRDYDELKNKIEYYIDNEEIRIQYAQKGYEWAKNNETYLNRFKIILNELEICKRSK